jgi:hypothetical protein
MITQTHGAKQSRMPWGMVKADEVANLFLLTNRDRESSTQKSDPALSSRLAGAHKFG